MSENVLTELERQLLRQLQSQSDALMLSNQRLSDLESCMHVLLKKLDEIGLVNLEMD